MSADEKVNILMVDDQPAKLLSYEVMLKDLDVDLIKATSASTAQNSSPPSRAQKSPGRNA